MLQLKGRGMRRSFFRTVKFVCISAVLSKLLVQHLLEIVSFHMKTVVSHQLLCICFSLCCLQLSAVCCRIYIPPPVDACPLHVALVLKLLCKVVVRASFQMFTLERIQVVSTVNKDDIYWTALVLHQSLLLCLLSLCAACFCLHDKFL